MEWAPQSHRQRLLGCSPETPVGKGGRCHWETLTHNEFHQIQWGLWGWMTLESCFKLKGVLHPAAIGLRAPLGGARAIPRKDSSWRGRASAKEGIWVKRAGTCQGAGTGGEHVHRQVL